MKLNKKIIFVIFCIVVIVILIFCIFNKKGIVICELKKDSLNTEINIEMNKKINFIYDYSFETMDETVDKYDSINSYLKILKEIKGVKSNIEQIEKKVNYFIDIDLAVVKEEDYKILNIVELNKLKNTKEIIEYYEKQGFTCR